MSTPPDVVRLGFSEMRFYLPGSITDRCELHDRRDERTDLSCSSSGEAFELLAATEDGVSLWCRLRSVNCGSVPGGLVLRLWNRCGGGKNRRLILRGSRRLHRPLIRQDFCSGASQMAVSTSTIGDLQPSTGAEVTRPARSAKSRVGSTTVAPGSGGSPGASVRCHADIHLRECVDSVRRQWAVLLPWPTDEFFQTSITKWSGM